MYRYTVKCTFTSGDADLIESWLEWLKNGHIADVMRGGASGAEVILMNVELPTFEIRYRFPAKASFEQYLAEHAPRLRDEGLSKFPLELGLAYERSDGQVVFETP